MKRGGRKKRRENEKKASSQDFETIFTFRKSSPRFRQIVQVKGAASRHRLCGLKKKKKEKEKEQRKERKKEGKRK